MEDFKLEIFRNERPGEPFPEFRSLQPGEAERIRGALVRKAGFNESVDGMTLLKALSERSRAIESVNAKSEGFHLAVVTRSLNLEPQENVYVNWDDFATIDRMRFKDLAEYFDYVWYPGPDDIEIFDDSLTWVLFVDHGGYLRVLRL